MLKIFVDGSADMPEGWSEKYDFMIIPIPIQFGNKTYYQGVDITPELFYELIQDKNNLPKTAAPSPEMIKKMIAETCRLGDTVLSINVSSKMSGTFNMVQQAAEELKGQYDIIPIDSTGGSALIALMAREVRRSEEKGINLEGILEVLKNMREKVLIVLTLDTLEFAFRSGRVSALKAALTSFLKIKPIITLKEGRLSVTELVRTRRASLEKLIAKVKDQFGDRKIKAAIVHSQDQITANVIKTMLESAMDVSETIFTELSISVAANLGPKTVGIVALLDKI